MHIPSLYDLSIAGKRVLIREDLNVPLDGGRITSDARILAALPTLQHAIDQQAAVMVMSHVGRPHEGCFDPEFSLQPVADYLSQALSQPVRCVRDWIDGINVNPGELVLCENVRFQVGEMENSPALAQKMASLCDVFVMDAFATAHRAQASTAGVAQFADIACAGPLLVSEINAIGRAMHSPKRPLVAVVGGSKVSTKLSVLDAMIEKVDVLIVGGGIANTFLAATGIDVGASLYEPDQLDTARSIMTKSEQLGVKIPLPTDTLVATEFSPDAVASQRPLDSIAHNEQILDVGPDTAATYQAQMAQAQTIIWNGPVGVFEFPNFAQGTAALGQAIADSEAFSLAGGGDTLAALDLFDLKNKISYVSTGGGAFLEYIEGRTLPAIYQLQQRVITHATDHE